MRLRPKTAFVLKNHEDTRVYAQRILSSTVFLRVFFAREVRVRPRVFILCVAYAHAYLYYV